METQSVICRDCKHVIDENSEGVVPGSYLMYCSLCPLILDIDPITGVEGYRTERGDRTNLKDKKFGGCHANNDGDCPDFEPCRNIVAKICNLCGKIVGGKKGNQ